MAQSRAEAGEIPGLPANLPPGAGASIDVGLYNDFLGRGGGSDDFRTQQFILTGRLDQRWYLTLDNSILTRQEPGRRGRVDQLTATLAYAVIDQRGEDTHNRLLAGLGYRAHGNYAGERIQNGFHQLIGNDLEFLPYVDGEPDSPVAWFDAERQRSAGAGGAWHPGYWLRVSGLATADGQFDASLGAYATLEHDRITLWAGFRQDWRSGYGSLVMSAVADAESDTSAVFGLRWGALVVETVQQFNNDASYGAIRFVAAPGTRRPASVDASRYAVTTGIVLPDVQVSVEGRYAPGWLNRGATSWSTAVTAALFHGEPQLGDVNTLYTDTTELVLGVDRERPLIPGDGRSAWFAGVGLGARREQLFGDGVREGEKAEAVTGAVAQAGLGIRIRLNDLSPQWRLRLQVGASLSVPFESRTVAIGNEQRKVLEPTLSTRVSVLFEHR